MAFNIPGEAALSICRKIRDENRASPSSPQALRCRSCEACSGGTAIKPGGRACCQVRQRFARLVVTSA